MENRAIPKGKTPNEVGCYLLLRIYRNPPIWKPEIEEWIADACYKERIDAPFYPGCREIRLKPLFNRFSTSYKLVDYDNCSKKLLHTVVQINEIKSVFIDGYTTFAIDWKPVQEYELNELVTMFPYYYKKHPPVYPRANIYDKGQCY